MARTLLFAPYTMDPNADKPVLRYVRTEVEIEDDDGEYVRVKLEMLEHPTRDDMHEQREVRQRNDGMLRCSHHEFARPREPHGFDGTRLPRRGW